MKRNPLGFTLIELLVVISIIAILAATAVPVINGAILRGLQANALSNARQIAMALKMFANDNGGSFPSDTNSYGEKIVTSNDAFRSLVPNYTDNEQIFAVSRSKAGPKADNKTDPAQEILRPGENHFAYITGLSTTSNSNWPVVVDSTDGSGHYTTVEGDYGGTWKGMTAIAASVDGSVKIVTLQGTGTRRFLPRFDDPTKDGLAVSDYMGSDAKLLEPARK